MVDVALITDLASTEGSRYPLSEAVKSLLGVNPIELDARDFLTGGAGSVSVVEGRLTLRAAHEARPVEPSIVIIYEIPPAKRHRFAPFQRKLRACGVISLGLDPDAWRTSTLKDRTVEAFVRDGVPHMETVTLRRPTIQQALATFDALGRNVWTRPTIGSSGDDVFHVTTEDQARRAVKLYARAKVDWQMARDAGNIDTNGFRHDFRVVVLHGRVLAVFERTQATPGQPCNLSRGATDRTVPVQSLPPAVAEMAIAATRSVGLAFGGVDVAIETNAVFEVNVHPVLSRGDRFHAVVIPYVQAHIDAFDRQHPCLSSAAASGGGAVGDGGVHDLDVDVGPGGASGDLVDL